MTTVGEFGSGGRVTGGFGVAEGSKTSGISGTTTVSSSVAG